MLNSARGTMIASGPASIADIPPSHPINTRLDLSSPLSFVSNSNTKPRTSQHHRHLRSEYHSGLRNRFNADEYAHLIHLLNLICKFNFSK